LIESLAHVSKIEDHVIGGRLADDANDLTLPDFESLAGIATDNGFAENLHCIPSEMKFLATLAD
jgi:hypothetical protein